LVAARAIPHLHARPQLLHPHFDIQQQMAPTPAPHPNHTPAPAAPIPCQASCTRTGPGGGVRGQHHHQLCCPQQHTPQELPACTAISKERGEQQQQPGQVLLLPRLLQLHRGETPRYNVDLLCQQTESECRHMSIPCNNLGSWHGGHAPIPPSQPPPPPAAKADAWLSQTVYTKVSAPPTHTASIPFMNRDHTCICARQSSSSDTHTHAYTWACTLICHIHYQLHPPPPTNTSPEAAQYNRQKHCSQSSPPPPHDTPPTTTPTTPTTTPTTTHHHHPHHPPPTPTR
jgi:hypothetical protein